MTTSNRNNRGFTLVEMVVAILIMMVGMLGLLEAISVATDHGLQNQLRDEAVKVGEKYLNIQKAKPFDLLSTSYGIRYEPSKVRGGDKPYSVQMATVDISNNPVSAAKEVQVTVRWSYKGVTYENRVVSPVAVIR